MQRRKFLTWLLVALCVGTSSFGTAACKTDEDGLVSDDGGEISSSESSVSEENASEGLQYALSEDGAQYVVIGVGVCTDLNVVIPSTYNGKPVTGIGANAFDGCSDLQNIRIPDSVTSIGDKAFIYCRNLTSITIPVGVTYVASYTFNGCSNLDCVYYKGTESDWANIVVENFYSANDHFMTATKYYYSETQPTEAGNYWHYDKNGEIHVWR